MEEDFIKITIKDSEDNDDMQMITSFIAYDKLSEIENKQILYSLVGILDNFKHKINYMIESYDMIEEEMEEEEFKKNVDDEIEGLMNEF